MIPDFLKCCCESRVKSQQVINTGRRKLRKESNILKLIQRQRYFGLALSEVLGRVRRQELKAQAKYWVLDVDHEANAVKGDKSTSDYDTQEGPNVSGLITRRGQERNQSFDKGGLNHNRSGSLAA